MKKPIYTALLITTIAFATPASAFDIGGLVTNAIKDAVKEEVTETTKDITKEAVKGAASAAGIEGADNVIDYAADNAGSIQNNAAGISTLSNAAGSGGVAGASAALSGAAIAAEQVRIINGGATPADKYKQEYMAINNKMSNCGTDSDCIVKYQQELIALQKRGNAYVAQTGDANYDGEITNVDAQIDATVKKSAAAIRKSRMGGGYND